MAALVGRHTMATHPTTARVGLVAVVAGALGTLTAMHAGRRQGLRVKASTAARVLGCSTTRRVVAAQEAWARLQRLRPMGVRVWPARFLACRTSLAVVVAAPGTLLTAVMAALVVAVVALSVPLRVVAVR